MIFLKVRFLKGLEDMSLNSLHKDQEAIRNPVVHVRKRKLSLIDAILSVINGYVLSNVFQLLIPTLYFHREKND